MTDSASAGIGAPTPGPLSGLVVADFSRVLAGPYATMLLADLGAEVIKVESPSGDDTRHWIPPVRDGTGTVRAAMNVTVHAAETSVEVLTGEHLPRLIRTAAEVSGEWALWQSRPHTDFATPA